MSSFDLIKSAPGLLRAEALNMTLKFERLSDTTGRVSWNIPSPAAGCDSNTQAYNGIVITVDNTAFSSKKIPTNGTIYEADNTVDRNLHAGDKIESSLVVGAFYNDKETVFVDLTGLTPNTPYYVSGYPVDAQNRFFREGIHAYSLNAGREEVEGTHGKQVIALNVGSTNGVTPSTFTSISRPADSGTGLASDNLDINNIFTSGLSPTDPTGLVAGITYKFKIQKGLVPNPVTPVDIQECVPVPEEFEICIDGTLASDYQGLMDEINKQFLLIRDPLQSANPPNTGSLYVNQTTKKLFSWDGTTHVELPVIFNATQPDLVNVGDYWYDTTNNALFLWDGSAWQPNNIICFSSDPLSPICDETVWFDGTNAFIWNGVSWTETTTFIQPTDPSLKNENQCGSFWFNTDDQVLYKWNDKNDMWVAIPFIKYFEDPSNLSNGALWFQTTQLFSWDATLLTWNEETNVFIGNTEPTNPAAGKFWFNPETNILQQYNGTTMVWDTIPVIVSENDPTDRSLTKIWWDDNLNVINVWNDSTDSWVASPTFFNQSIDPILPPAIKECDFWFDGTKLFKFIKGCFKEIEFINWATDPTTSLSVGQVWKNSNNEFFVLNASNTWDSITPLFSDVDPTIVPTGTYWFDTTNSQLFQWNGIAWISLIFSNNPITPEKGLLWFDTNTMQLMTWNGSSWEIKTPECTVEMNCYGNLEFTDSTVGSLSYVAIENINLWDNLDVTFSILNPEPGEDGISSENSYEEMDVGTDGSSDERFKMMNDIRYDLGYPVVDVELTQEQLDFAISRALEELRYRSSVCYKRGFFFMQVTSETQRYRLTNKVQGMNKIVNVIAVHRLTSAFLSSAHGAGIYGQIVLQHLYNLGAFDLLSYHIMSEYTSLLEIMLAGRITFTFNEQTRELWMHHRFPFSENMVAIEASVERTEQDILSDRWIKAWVRRYATATAREILAEIRGKYSSLPAAGGGVSLNPSELRQRAIEDKALCIQEIEDYVVDHPEEYGFGTQFLYG